MKQNGEGADKVHQTNGEEMNGDKPNCEISDVVLSSDDDHSEYDSVDENNEDSNSSSSDEDVLGFVFGLRKEAIGFAKLSCRLIGASIGPSSHLPHGLDENDILQAFGEDKAMVKAALASLDSKICLSIDILSETLSFDKYLKLSAHLIDENWKLKKWVLKFCKVNSVEGGEIDDAVLDALKVWEIEGKVFSFTMVGALLLDHELVQTLRNCVEEKSKLPLEGKLFNVDCCARVFTLMAKDAYKEISDVISKVQDLVLWKCAHLWYMPAYNLKKALELESTGEFSTENIGDDYDVPSVEEWAKARCVSELVIGLYEIVKTLFESKYPTANNCLHKFQELRAMLSQEASGTDNFKSKIAKKMLERLDKYWDGMSLTLAITSVMDPRFKMSYLDYLSSKGEVSGNKLQTSVILDAIQSLYGDYVTCEEKREYPVSDDSSSSVSEDELPKTVVEEQRCDSVQVQEYIRFIESVKQSPKSDLDRYLEDPVVSWSQDFNVLSWWRVEGAKYPTLSKMARDILAIPLSVATKYAAYFKERVVDPRISSLGSDEIKNALVCASTWDEKPLR